LGKCKTVLLWILALQLLNMSIYTDAYWQFSNGRSFSILNNEGADPTETILEWLVEMKMGQQDMFTYDSHNIDSKNVVKVMGWHMDQDRHLQEKLIFFPSRKSFYYPDKKTDISSTSYDILTPPPRNRAIA
jgi:hypothetical protein